MAAKSNERRAIVIGGSIAGLFVGAFLGRIGWRVDIYERSSIELIGRGVGIFAAHLELFKALDKCGAGTVDIGVSTARSPPTMPCDSRSASASWRTVAD
jgi:2-polyprenyl-6-methoxyphenol hydroxylase-like FAD-dependent oxidoreductase